MPLSVSHLEGVITEFRHTLPAESATAQAIDDREPLDQIAMKAIDDGYIKDIDQFALFVEASLEFSEYGRWLSTADQRATRH